IFRGALDVQATHINEPMKIAAARALADLTREIVPDDVRAAYGGESIRFGPDYIIPKPVDGRSLSWVASAVAEAALESGVAGKQIDVNAYREELERKLSPTRRVMWRITSAARSNPKRIVFPEGEEEKILKAAAVVAEERIAQPILIGRPSVVRSIAEKIGVDLSGVEIVDRQNLPNLDEFAEQY
ncbi:MAG: NADP-dependent malic enzyme, partial [bacterium]|nr:NADP-dependent malic enzyme [bacterium]